jgi:hypothetical protein
MADLPWRGLEGGKMGRRDSGGLDFIAFMCLIVNWLCAWREGLGEKWKKI